MAELEEIEGLGPASAEKLRAIGIRTHEELLHAATGADGIEGLATETRIHPNKLRRWLAHADLLCIEGLNGRHAGLLMDCKIRSTHELAQRDPSDLALDLAAANALDRRLNRPPPLELVQRWVDHARNRRSGAAAPR